MRNTFAFFLVFLAFVQFCISVTVHFNSSLTDFETFTTTLNGISPFPMAPGKVNITFTAPFSAEICIQEGFVIDGPLSVCNPNGYFSFNVNATTPKSEIFEIDMSDLLFRDFDNLNQGYFTSFSEAAPQTFRNSTLLTPGSFYFVQVRSTNAGNVTKQFHLEISWETPCKSHQVASVNNGCQYWIPFANGNPNIFPAGATVYFPIVINSKQNIKTINFTGEINVDLAKIYSQDDNQNANITMYLRRGAAPDPDHYDAKSSLLNANTSLITFDSPLPGNWFLSVTNPTIEDQNVRINETTLACDNDCYNATDLTGTSTVSLQVGTGSFQYFTVKTFNLQVGTGTEDVEDIAPPIWVSNQIYPTNASYQVTSQGNTVNYIESAIPFLNGTNQTAPVWKIAVLYEEGEEYYIWANTHCPNNCQGDLEDDDDDDDEVTQNGQCTQVNGVYTGYCTCDEDYEGLTCTASGLATVWIVLIVIACIIVLAIAIGIPLAIYLKNKSRARYERV